MEFIDTHTHLYLEDYDSDHNAVVSQALNVGVTRMILPNVGLETIVPMKELAAAYPENMRMAMGLHPSEVNADFINTLQTIEDELRTNAHTYIAVGEIGMDLYYSPETEKMQMDAFESQLTWAMDLQKPVIIHCRSALPQLLEVMQPFSSIRCVFHCFGGTQEDVEMIRKHGDHYFGIGGVLTFKNSDLSSVIPEIGLSRIVLETDSPYLSPAPLRGKRNESSRIPLIATRLAEVTKTPVEAVADATTYNAKKLFGF